MFFCQNNAALAAQKELSEKIEKYQYIDTLSSKDYLHYSISIKEGNIEMFDKNKKEHGRGGFSVYTYKTTSKPQKLLKSVHKQVVHYNQSKSQIQNSENIVITIFYDDNRKPDLAKITENHYTADEVLLSSLNYINLPKDIEESKKIIYTKEYLKGIIDHIFDEVKEVINRP
ncbi:hypothetical protein ODZ84_17505 [Chryseobacterium fluminis]|uniref:hypothetical protein n=1 Tax=Chryseobacterium fluminis TaxID=2983606 RepID=UPI00225B1A91|nr:hypothetical protein [Chryseobacterium sp. MMS21-Ot14]UZT96984.1 hypothetical protein ODZ84_17505 [Chryseobacterium sp. MMS21-Ot14]